QARTTTLIKTETLEVIRLVIPSGKVIPRHQAHGEITVQMAVLSGLIKRAGSTAFCQGAHHVLHGSSQEGNAKANAPVLVALNGLEPGVFAPPAAYTA